MGKNIESFVANGTIEVTSLDFNLEVDIDKIRNLIESTKTTGNSEQSNILHSTLSEDESSAFEKMVREIRDSRNVNIYSSDASSSLRGSDYFEPVAILKKWHASSNDEENKQADTRQAVSQKSVKYPVCSELYDPKSATLSSEADQDHHSTENSEPEQRPRIMRKKVIITTTPGGDFPLPLPSWTDPRPIPSVYDVEAYATWEKNVAIQKHWTSKYPWFADSYDKLEVNQELEDWINGVNSKRPEPEEKETGPESIPLPPQDEHEILHLTEDKDIKPEDIPLPYIEKEEQEK